MSNTELSWACSNIEKLSQSQGNLKSEYEELEYLFGLTDQGVGSGEEAWIGLAGLDNANGRQKFLEAKLP